ncbi:MAG: hypothetical protein HY537_09815, partial [Deltaproteobacteria bacterium]|nr:hypothetical protein [Deltaproteobacteria bacterium]
TRYSRTGLPWVVLGQFGFLEVTSKDRLDVLFRSYDARFTGIEKAVLFASPSQIDARRMQYERRLNEYEQYPPLFVSRAEHWLKLKSHGLPQSSAVFLSPKISVAYGNYGLYSDPSEGRKQWHINPFVFFRKSFSIDPNVPVPDVAVLNGRRIFFSHIDGDAFHSISQKNVERYCSELIRTEILERYSTLPFGVSVIVAEVDERERGNRRLQEVARQIFALPNVEIASHTYYHPLEWGTGKLSYSMNKAIDEQREVVESVRYIRDNLAGNKLVKAVYWSGDCMPSEGALKLARMSAVHTINGGDGRFDSEFPSLAYLSPLGRPVGSEFQVFSANANDNLYTHGWTGPYFGFRHAIQTFERTKHPILKPINPYFHFFAGENDTGIKSVQAVLDWSITQPISPVFPSTYIESVFGFRNAIIEKVGRLHYRITGARGLRTLRFDSIDWIPDLERCRGLIGFSVLDGKLYVYLSNQGAAEIVLRAKHVKFHLPPYLHSVGGLVEQMVGTGKRLSYVLAPYSRGPLTIGGITKSRIDYTDGTASHSLPVREGRVEIPLEPRRQSSTIEVIP